MTNINIILIRLIFLVFLLFFIVFLISSLLTDFDNYQAACLPAIKFYDNFLNNKEKISKDNKNLSGIYKLTNKINGKIYVGSAKDLWIRLRHYYVEANLLRAKPMLICAALLKYGHANFTLEILDYCTLVELIAREQYWIDLLKPEYNTLKKAGSSLGYIHTEDNKAKISKSRTGQKQSQEAIAKIAKAMLGNKNGLANLPAAISVEVIDNRTNDKIYYPSITKAAQGLDCTPPLLCKMEKNKGNSFSWRDYQIKINRK